jgi:hypothetical protein
VRPSAPVLCSSWPVEVSVWGAGQGGGKGKRVGMQRRRQQGEAQQPPQLPGCCPGPRPPLPHTHISLCAPRAAAPLVAHLEGARQARAQLRLQQLPVRVEQHDVGVVVVQDNVLLPAAAARALQRVCRRRCRSGQRVGRGGGGGVRWRRWQAAHALLTRKAAERSSASHFPDPGWTRADASSMWRLGDGAWCKGGAGTRTCRRPAACRSRTSTRRPAGPARGRRASRAAAGTRGASAGSPAKDGCVWHVWHVCRCVVTRALRAGCSGTAPAVCSSRRRSHQRPPA